MLWVRCLDAVLLHLHLVEWERCFVAVLLHSLCYWWVHCVIAVHLYSLWVGWVRCLSAAQHHPLGRKEGHHLLHLLSMCPLCGPLEHDHHSVEWVTVLAQDHLPPAAS